MKPLAKKLLSYGPQGVVLEASGGYEALVMQVFEAAGLTVIRMNPQRVRAFAQAEGIRAKTDALDAYVLARFGVRMQPVARAGSAGGERGRTPAIGHLGSAGRPSDAHASRGEDAAAASGG